MATASVPRRPAAATEGFNQRALRWMRPGPRWGLDALRIGLFMAALGLALQAAVTLLAELLAPDRPQEPSPERNLLLLAVVAVVLAPIIETAILVLVHRLTRARVGLTGFVLVTAVLAAVDHASGRNWLPLAGVATFTVMAYQYASFRARLGPSWAYVGVVLSHATCTGVMVALAALLHLLPDAT